MFLLFNVKNVRKVSLHMFKCYITLIKKNIYIVLPKLVVFSIEKNVTSNNKQFLAALFIVSVLGIKNHLLLIGMTLDLCLQFHCIKILLTHFMSPLFILNIVLISQVRRIYSLIFNFLEGERLHHLLYCLLRSEVGVKSK